MSLNILYVIMMVVVQLTVVIFVILAIQGKHKQALRLISLPSKGYKWFVNLFREDETTWVRKNVVKLLDEWLDLYDVHDVVPVAEHKRMSKLVLEACPNAEDIGGLVGGSYVLLCKHTGNEMLRQSCDQIKCPYRTEV